MNTYQSKTKINIVVQVLLAMAIKYRTISGFNLHVICKAIYLLSATVIINNKYKSKKLSISSLPMLLKN